MTVDVMRLLVEARLAARESHWLMERSADLLAATERAKERSERLLAASTRYLASPSWWPATAPEADPGPSDPPT